MAITILSGYPAPPGSKKEVVVDVTGPTSYGALTFSGGQPVSGGQKFTARSLGIGGLVESISVEGNGAITTTGYTVRAFLSPSLAGEGSAFVYLQWVTAATGAEVSSGDISAARVRLRITAVSY